MKKNGVHIILNQRGCGKSLYNVCGSYFSHSKPVWYVLAKRDEQIDLIKYAADLVKADIKMYERAERSGHETGN